MQHSIRSLLEPVGVKYVADGDIGCGAPGDPRWHLCVLSQLETDEEIISYVKGALSIEIDPESDVRARAMEIINGNST